MATHATLTVQQLEVSRFNHPCGDLFNGVRRRREYLDIGVRLYRASAEGDLETAKAILRGQEYLLTFSITEYMETPLHVAIMSRHTKFVRYLVRKMSPEDLELQNGDGRTAFCLAAISGNVGMAKIMVKKNPTLPYIMDIENMMPLYLAAFHGKHEMVTFLYDRDKMKGHGWTNDHRNEVLLKCIQGNIFDVAIQILKDNEELPEDKHVWNALHLLAQKPVEFHEIRSWTTTSKIKSLLVKAGFVTRPALKESSATLLLRLLLKRIAEKPKDDIDEILRDSMIQEYGLETDPMIQEYGLETDPMIQEYGLETDPSQILFVAAKMNNTNFLVELIREYPDIIWQRNDDGQTMFHIAVAHRHLDVYNLLYDIGSMKDFITPITDNQGNNLLHMVGKIPEKTAYEDTETTPYEILCEYFWYKEVKDILPPPCRQVRNAAGRTPEEEFIDNHKKEIALGMQWIHGTISQSMVVAALVCTIGFSIVYSIPGGFDQTSGFPIFRQSKLFIWFILVDALSFILSTSSILIFLSIILSRNEGHKEKVLQRWMAGQLALLNSLITIVVAFISSFFVLYPNSKFPYIICSNAIVIFLLYSSGYSSLYKDSVCVTLRGVYMVKPKRQMIYCQNPRI